jgi:hypothetical protein
LRYGQILPSDPPTLFEEDCDTAYSGSTPGTPTSTRTRSRRKVVGMIIL